MPIRTGKEKEGVSHVLFFGLTLFIFLLDQFTKHFLSQWLMNVGHRIEMIPPYFYLALVHNTGTAFGLFKNARLFLVVTTLFSLLLILFLYFRWGKKGILWKMGLGMILGGALGNLWDRITYHFVIDFFQVFIGSHEWPTFNVADSAITGGAVLLGIYFLKEKKINSPNPSLN
ncbi:MAG: signal peptidase II [Chlamydiae bacterium]|nr:signal peptidase II [Chlamydiota bacterium]MBI3266120.1 signal peptidase II [Chlamydiota bacterium]